jgi:hypothetical protein
MLILRVFEEAGDVLGKGEPTATIVPGRKTVVRTAMVFIADESCLLSWAISLLCSDNRVFNLFPMAVMRDSS